MIDIIRALAGKEIRTMGAAVSAYRNIKKGLQDKKAEIKIALLSSFSVNGMAEAIRVLSAAEGICAEVYTAGYGMYAQELIDDNSGYHKFCPDITFLMISERSLCAEGCLNPFVKSEGEWKRWAKETVDEIGEYISKIRESGSLAVVTGLRQSAYHPLGILENKSGFSLNDAVAQINAGLTADSRGDSGVFIYDTDRFALKYGSENTFDEKWYFNGDFHISPDGLVLLASEFMGYLLPMAGKSRKVLVLDLDNTLWGGVVGEDGEENIRLGPTNEGRVFWEFQKMILGLFNRGVILALNSKNNYDDAMSAIQNHPYMVLREKHFGAVRINWQDKAQNLMEIAEELNVGLSSMVFLDDDPMNRELVRDLTPEVLVPEMPSDPAGYISLLKRLVCFNTLSFTEEDGKKGEMYFQQKQREKLKKSSGNIQDFLASLQISVQISKNNAADIPRISQLTLKTNQFNTTTRRYTEADIEDKMKNGVTVYGVKVADKFGDNGLTGVAIVNDAGDGIEIDSFLLSCRVIGRGIESALLAEIANDAILSGKRWMSGCFIPSVKNAPAADFYKNSGGILKKEGEVEVWSWNLEDKWQFPVHIEQKGE